MQPYEYIELKRKERGIPKAELARRVGMNEELLRRSLQGTRKLTVPECIGLCRELHLTLKDFD